MEAILQNPYVITTITVLLVLFGARAAPPLTGPGREAFNNVAFRTLWLGLLLYMLYPRRSGNLLVTLLVAAVFVQVVESMQ